MSHTELDSHATLPRHRQDSDHDKQLAAADREPGPTLGSQEGEEEETADWEDDDEVEPAPAHADEDVNPRMQAKLRQTIRDDMKPRGKKAAAMKAKGPSTTKAKAEKAPKAPKSKAKAKAKAKSTGRGRGKGKGKGDDLAEELPGKKRRGGKQRVPPVLPDGTVLSLGCSSCRFAERGCPTCEKATFRGKRRSDVSPDTIRKARATLQSKAAKDEE